MEGGGGGIGIEQGLTTIVRNIIGLFGGGDKGPSSGEKAVVAFDQVLLQGDPTLTPEQIIRTSSEGKRRQFFDEHLAIARSLGITAQEFLFRFLPVRTFESTKPGADPRIGGRIAALSIPNIHRLISVQLGLAEPIAPRRTERPGIPTAGPVDFARWLSILWQIIFGPSRRGQIPRSDFPRDIGQPTQRPPGPLVPVPPRPRQTLPPNTLPRQQLPWWWDLLRFPRIQLPGGRNVPLLDDFGTFLGNLTQAAFPILRATGVIPPPEPLFGMPGSGFPVSPAAAGTFQFGFEGVPQAPQQLPSTVAPGPMGPLAPTHVGGGCIAPVTTVNTRLPRIVDIPMIDAGGNVKMTTYVKAPRPKYKIRIAASGNGRRKARGCN